MILSMTGYGVATREESDLSIAVEVRSVNNRYLKTSYRMPEYLSPMEADFERILRGQLSRGAVTVTVRCKLMGAVTAPAINTDVLAGYAASLKRIAAETGLAGDIPLGTLLSLPGVFDEVGPTADIAPVRERILRTLEEAIVDFRKMRRTEGKSLEEDLRSHATVIREHLARIKELAPRVVEEYRDRLLARVAMLLKEAPVQMAEEKLLGEVSVFAERSDISEELSRLESHLSQFDDLLASDQPAGRKLEFVSQEMLREANTIGSKSGHADISRRIVEIKAAVDRIKEQVQNAE